MGLVRELVQAIGAFWGSSPGFFALLACSAIMWIPAVLIHELGHGLAMQAVYGGPVVVDVGAGPTWLESRFGEIRVRVNGIPTGGLARTDARAQPGVMLRHHLAVILAGPGASALGAALAGIASNTAGGGVAHALLWCFACLNGSTALSNLVPFEYVTRSGARWHSDGARTLRLLSIAHTGRIPNDRLVLHEVSDRSGRRIMRVAVIALLGFAAFVAATALAVQMFAPA